MIATLPDDHHAQQALTDAAAAGHQAQHAAGQAGQLSDQLAELGRFARFGERGRTLRAQLGTVRDRERQAVERQQCFEQEAETHQARLVERRQVWEAEHPGARERHQAATDAYQHAQERYHAAEQTHDALIAHDLVAAAFPERGARRWPRPDHPPKPELQRPGIERGPYRGREGPSLGR